RRLDVLREHVDDFESTLDGLHVLVREDQRLLALPADRKLPADDPAHVEVDLSRIRLQLHPVAEWTQMFDEAVRLMRDHYWREDMGGVDWDAAARRYRPLVERLAGRDDLIDVLWETYAELGTSHAYVLSPPGPPPPEESQGLLGADVRPDADGTWRIAKILPGESSDPAARSPLRAAGVGAREGDSIVEVSGQPVDSLRGPAPALVGAAGKPTELTLQPADAGSPRRRVVVVPLADEEPLRYQAWVADRREYVRRRSDGRVGYLHVPDMMGLGWAQLHRDLSLATSCEGIVVDVRFNRGGHVSQLVIERLGRRVHAYQLGRHAGSDTYPDNAPRGPLVFVANQWSGSDGDIVNAMAQEMGIGPVVGVRTWGGVVGIDGRFKLVDGTDVTQPRYATWIQNREWSVENYGVDPDIEVPMTPADHAAGRDPQLDRAVDEVLARLEERPASVPPELPAL
ncbi:MAG: PDZ domain-containing protein, partial [Actinomycetota bacterium]|nr:PDZ domain-containing protein [Actinomycetota bacterium]